MSDGGFLLKFDGKEGERCHAVSFDFDDWEYVINGTEKKSLPPAVSEITVVVEE